MINNIQALRAFAAINVVLYHIFRISGNYEKTPEALSFIDGWGANGVDIFFVISGFVMMYTQMNDKKSISDFLKARILRLTPIYWLVTSVGISFYYLYPSLGGAKLITYSWGISSFLFASNFIHGVSPIVNVGWTLEWEMLFYLIFSVSFLLRRWRDILLTVGMIMVLVSVITQSLFILEFVFGMAIAYLYKSKKLSETKGLLIFIFGSILLLLSTNETIKGYPLDRLVVWGVPSAFIVLGAVYAKQINSHFLSYLGDASYSIYLSHTIGIYAFYEVSTLLLLPFNNLFLATLCLAFCLIGGCVMHSYIEKPITRLFKRRVFLVKNRILPST